MRVEGSRVLSLFRRRSIQRLIHAATSTNKVSVNSSFNTDHTVTRLLPAAMPMLSRPAMIGLSQPRYSAAITSQMISARRFSRCCIHDSLPRLAANSSTPMRTAMYAPIRRAAESITVTS